MKSKPLHILFVGMLPSQITQLNTVLLKGGFAVTSSSLPDAQHLTDVQLSASDVLLIDSLRSHPEIVEQIQAELSAQNLDIPILVYSSLGDEAAIVAALKAGAKDFISSKNPQRILSSVQRELDCVHKRAQLAEQARADQLLHDIAWLLWQRLGCVALGLAASKPTVRCAWLPLLNTLKCCANLVYVGTKVRTVLGRSAWRFKRSRR